MAVTELARLKVLRGTSANSPSFQDVLRKAKTAMEQASGRSFYYFECIEDPNVIYILGSWPSVEFHMQKFIPGRANQEVLELLKGKVEVEYMFHIDIDQDERPLPLDQPILAIGRHFVKHGDHQGLKVAFDENKHELEGFAGKGQVVGGWRVDDGINSSRKGEQETGQEEFVLFTAWQSKEHHFGFAKTEGFQRYDRIREHIDGAEIRHAKLVKVDGRQ